MAAEVTEIAVVIAGGAVTGIVAGAAASGVGAAATGSAIKDRGLPSPPTPLLEGAGQGEGEISTLKTTTTGDS